MIITSTLPIANNTAYQIYQPSEVSFPQQAVQPIVEGGNVDFGPASVLDLSPEAQEFLQSEIQEGERFSLPLEAT